MANLYTDIGEGDLATPASINDRLNALRKGDTFNIKAYGAVGDGTTDDLTAINAAIDAANASGGVVFVPRGTFRYTASLPFKDKVRFLGAGEDASILYYDPASVTTGAAIRNPTPTSSVRVGMARLTVKATSNATGKIIDYSGVSNSAFRELAIVANGATGDAVYGKGAAVTTGISTYYNEFDKVFVDDSTGVINSLTSCFVCDEGANSNVFTACRTNLNNNPIEIRHSSTNQNVFAFGAFEWAVAGGVGALVAGTANLIIGNRFEAGGAGPNTGISVSASASDTILVGNYQTGTLMTAVSDSGTRTMRFDSDTTQTRYLNVTEAMSASLPMNGWHVMNAGSVRFYHASGASTAGIEAKAEGVLGLLSADKMTIQSPFRASSGNYTATGADEFIELTASGVTLTLPSAVTAESGKRYVIVLNAAGTGTVATTGGQTISGAATYSLAAQYNYVEVISNGANWLKVSAG